LDATPLAMAVLALAVEAGLNRVCQTVLWSSARWRCTEWQCRCSRASGSRGLYAPTLTLGPEGIQAVAMPPE